LQHLIYSSTLEVIAAAVLIKQAGNSIVVDVLVAIFNEIYRPEDKVIKAPSLFDF
jgi:site-specific DNA-cytosine methylase